MHAFETTLLEQYANSPIMTALISNMNDYIDPSANLDSFYNNIWNIDTAVGYGLDVWGRIVGVIRVLNVANTAYFGFGEANSIDVLGFDQAPFYNGQSVTSNFSLTDDAFRTLIFAKALANITDGSIPAINQLLLNLFGSQGQCWCTDGENMTMTYTFNFALTPVDEAIIEQSGVLPRPPGVAATVVQI